MQMETQYATPLKEILVADVQKTISINNPVN
jgi:hypothetical protein